MADPVFAAADRMGYLGALQQAVPQSLDRRKNTSGHRLSTSRQLTGQLRPKEGQRQSKRS